MILLVGGAMLLVIDLHPGGLATLLGGRGVSRGRFPPRRPVPRPREDRRVGLSGPGGDRLDRPRCPQVERSFEIAVVLINYRLGEVDHRGADLLGEGQEAADCLPRPVDRILGREVGVDGEDRERRPPSDLVSELFEWSAIPAHGRCGSVEGDDPAGYPFLAGAGPATTQVVIPSPFRLGLRSTCQPTSCFPRTVFSTGATKVYAIWVFSCSCITGGRVRAIASRTPAHG